MPEKMEINDNKTLKLSNVLGRIITENEYSDVIKIVELMEGYIKSKGYFPVGPLIQCICVDVDSIGNPRMRMKLLRQSSNYINHIEAPYTMESIIRITQCFYIHFTGDESKIKLAYDKIRVYAYEHDIELTGNSYTVFVDRVDDTVIADIFMEKKL